MPGFVELLYYVAGLLIVIIFILIFLLFRGR